MNAENYVKAFQGIMGVYGLQFLLVPKKIVRFFDIILLRLFVVFSSRWYCCLFQIRSIIIPPVTSKGELGRQKETKLTSRISLSLSLNSHFDDDIRTHTHTWSALYAARRPLRLAGVRCCCRFFLVRIRFFLFVDWVFGVKHFLRGKIVVTLLFSLF